MSRINFTADAPSLEVLEKIREQLGGRTPGAAAAAFFRLAGRNPSAAAAILLEADDSELRPAFLAFVSGTSPRIAPSSKKCVPGALLERRNETIPNPGDAPGARSVFPQTQNVFPVRCSEPELGAQVCSQSVAGNVSKGVDLARGLRFDDDDDDDHQEHNKEERRNETLAWIHDFVGPKLGENPDTKPPDPLTERWLRAAQALKLVYRDRLSVADRKGPVNHPPSWAMSVFPDLLRDVNRVRKLLAREERRVAVIDREHGDRRAALAATNSEMAIRVRARELVASWPRERRVSEAKRLGMIASSIRLLDRPPQKDPETGEFFENGVLLEELAAALVADGWEVPNEEAPDSSPEPPQEPRPPRRGSKGHPTPGGASVGSLRLKILGDSSPRGEPELEAGPIDPLPPVGVREPDQVPRAHRGGLAVGAEHNARRDLRHLGS